MRYAIIENGVVVNVVVSDKPYGDNWVDGDGGNIGDLWDGNTFTTPPKQKDLDGEISAIEKACRAHIDKYGHWSSGPMIFDKAKATKPKSLALKQWAEGCWAQYFLNKAALTQGADLTTDMLVYPEPPYTIEEAMAE